MGKCWIKLQCLHRGIANLRVGFERRHKGISQPQPGLCDPRPGATEFRILFQRPLEKLEALAQLWLRVLVGINKALQVSIVRSCASRWTRRRDREFELQSIDDGARDLVL